MNKLFCSPRNDYKNRIAHFMKTVAVLEQIVAAPLSAKLSAAGVSVTGLRR